MSDYEATPRKKPSDKNQYRIPGQTDQLCEDIHNADVQGVSYGVYIGRKHDDKKDYGYRRRRI